MSSKPSLPKGTRDFGPATLIKRMFILDNIKSVFIKYGFLPLETPAMEKLSVLTGKYGEEGDRLLYKVLNSGDFLSKANSDHFDDSKKLAPSISEKGLRYDLTVPFARYVAMNRHELAFPFKRYQIQPVWRADRPQKGRYREFYQCDADVVGTTSLVCEVEIVGMINEIFEKLGIVDYEIKFNHRKLLEGICEVVGATEKLTELTISIDKLDKIGKEGVKEEMLRRGFDESQVEEVFNVLSIDGNNTEKVSELSEALMGSKAKEGLSQTKKFLDLLDLYKADTSHLKLDLGLARGLSYYTGMIFEVKILNTSLGSVSGGGRYDDLTSVFGIDNIPGVGFSFGVDRLYDAMEELDIFPIDTELTTQILISYFDQESFNFGVSILRNLRKNDVAVEIYPELVKLKKQLGYADKKRIPFVIIIGSDELKSGLVTLKDMKTGVEAKLNVEEVVSKFSN